MCETPDMYDTVGDAQSLRRFMGKASNSGP